MKTYDFNSFAKKFVSEWLDRKNVTYESNTDPAKPGITTFTVSEDGSTELDALLSYRLGLKA